MNLILSREFAAKFADEWLEAWNSHDLDRLLRHYATDVEQTSPFVPQILGTASDTVRGIAALRDYFSRALAIYPDLHFAASRVYLGARSVIIEYRSVGDRLSAELLEFNEAGLVCRVHAHYAE